MSRKVIERIVDIPVTWDVGMTESNAITISGQLAMEEAYRARTLEYAPTEVLQSQPANYYKVLNEDGTADCDERDPWSLPSQYGPGDWMPDFSGRIAIYWNGYHLVRPHRLPLDLGPVIYEAEPYGDCDEKHGDVYARTARLTRRCLGWHPATALLFGCDCIERVLELYYKQCWHPKHSMQTIAAIRDLVMRGEVEDPFGVVWGNNWTIPWRAARVVAQDAGGDRAFVAEWEWQAGRLMQYLYSGMEQSSSQALQVQEW